MLTRRALLAAGVVLAAGAALPKRAPRDPVQALADLAPVYLGFPVDRSVYEAYFRIRLDRVPERREQYLQAARASQEALLGPEYAWLHREVLEHFSRTEAWTRLGYASWPGKIP